ncbi:response regulator [Cellulophaga sp. HaHaR_3_176]|uniref:response regulator n=1 Tax=Cellulophaga sp. HaHaR_3_176 TaxID=1942464 RepID=UPI001C1F2259|nr:response regulator [Cellulophaga sp. HaHaR_3_176]QWX82702.1 response regulator [Cellulophaga sp. HaHaR_3_176]
MIEQSKKPFKILLVDDDEITNFITINKLKHLGFENVNAVENGQLALKHLEKNYANLIVLDINMPVMDGFEFLSYVEENNLYNGTPIIILTSSGRPSDKETADNYESVIDYLEKPLDFKKIQQILLKMNS